MLRVMVWCAAAGWAAPQRCAARPSMPRPTQARAYAFATAIAPPLLPGMAAASAQLPSAAPALEHLPAAVSTIPEAPLLTAVPAAPEYALHFLVAASEITPRGITAEDTVVFVLGCVPFLWAAVEFWRRIAVGDAFGTGVDSVVIKDSSGGRKNPVRRVLGKDAILAARVLFAIAFASGVLLLLAIADVTTGR
ncbi:hypothetical protein AB1Y20_015693 [Prymnesium parvum]|uniref:RDD domain-containing protein n=1 Tax=Prymnesium parvum TaxID=97485 RepID=A0AB34K263_PRYPA